MFLFAIHFGREGFLGVFLCQFLCGYSFSHWQQKTRFMAVEIRN